MMELTRLQFDILSHLAESRPFSGAQQTAAGGGPCPHTADTAMQALQAAGLVHSGGITPAGTAALEPYRAKRAIFLAAGFGSRMLPLTKTTPKPLIRVNGTRIIDTLLDACLSKGIDEIYIVRGYLAEQFDQLLQKYPMLRFIENPDYDSANNIASVMAARHLLSNAYILESDLLLSNPALITRYHYTSDVPGIWKKHTDDWCLMTDSDGFVCDEKIGGDSTYQMVGIYYLNAADGKRLSGHLEEAFLAPGGRDRYWETVPNLFCKGQYQICVRPCQDGDITEIDTLDELISLDGSYKQRQITAENAKN